MSVTINGTSGLVFNDASAQNTAATGFGFKNRIINGAMMIDQRNAGASVTTSSTGLNVYSLDRWFYNVSQASKFTIQQNAGSVTPPSSFINYLGCTSSSAYTVSASDNFLVGQFIEGFNFSDLGWGTANAQPVTLSFWVRSSLTGTFGGSILNNAFNRSYPFSYSIPVANTWISISVTIAGDTTGTWLNTNGIGLRVYFGLGVGSTNSGTAGSWTGSGFFSATGATSVVGTNGATFYITGVQLEKGSTATSFDYRPIGTELALCQRYAVVYGGTSTFEAFAYGFATATTVMTGSLALPVQQRASPSLSVTGSATISDGNNGFTIFVLSIPTSQNSLQYLSLQATTSGLTQFRPYRIEASNNTTVRLIISSEL